MTESRDGMARVWDVATGEPITPPVRHGYGVDLVVFSPDDRRVIAAARADSVSITNLAPDGRPLEDLALLTRTLVGHRVDAGGGLVPDVIDSSLQQLESTFGVLFLTSWVGHASLAREGPIPYLFGYFQAWMGLGMREEESRGQIEPHSGLQAIRSRYPAEVRLPIEDMVSS